MPPLLHCSNAFRICGVSSLPWPSALTVHDCPLCAGVDGGGPHGKCGDADARVVKATSAAKEDMQRISHVSTSLKTIETN